MQEALERLRSRIEEVSAWAEQATPPGAVPSTDDRSESTEVESTLGHVRGLSRSGGIAGGVFRGGRDIVDLGAPDGAVHVPVPGLVALLDLVPTDTILEVRTPDADLRAARIGDEAFAFELVPGNEAEVDEWLASLLPGGET
ncbi:MAG TPA: hypothetical protein VMO88_09520 [Acidimicrobiales bacterium]|nr:hypothetical protein [Acidimicrobiales bacterium]